MKKNTKEKIIEALEGKKAYRIFYKFADVVEEIVAGSEEEAEQIADERINQEKYSLKKETYCYEIEVDEVED